MYKKKFPLGAFPLASVDLWSVEFHRTEISTKRQQRNLILLGWSRCGNVEKDIVRRTQPGGIALHF
jgi:hypothetical protein